MAKTKGQRHKSDRQRRVNKETGQPTKTPIWKTLLEGFGIFATIVGILAAILAFLPKLSVGVSGSLEPANPVKSVFFLSNDGQLPVYDIMVKCNFPKVKYFDGSGIDSSPDSGFIFPESRANMLSPGHTMTLPCAHSLGFKRPEYLTEAEITIIVDFRPDYIWWHKRAVFPWRGEKAANGNWIWKSLPR